jgi:enamine deaminase RidA (YjgF/YER057c/UK114 family)
MNPQFNIQKFVDGIFEEDQAYKECIENILRNIDRGLERCGNDKEKIGRLLMVRNFLETKIPEAKSKVFDNLYMDILPIAV